MLSHSETSRQSQCVWSTDVSEVSELHSCWTSRGCFANVSLKLRSCVFYFHSITITNVPVESWHFTADRKLQQLTLSYISLQCHTCLTPSSDSYKWSMNVNQGTVGSDPVILATAGYDHTVRFWQAHSGICTRTVQHQDSVSLLSVTDRFNDKSVWFWNDLGQLTDHEHRYTVYILEGSTKSRLEFQMTTCAVDSFMVQ